MTAPRQVLAGTTYLVTRRCFQRQLLLRPSESTDQIFLFVLAVAAQRFGVRVHAFCVLSNHFHLVVTDHDARLPAFEQYLDSLVARAVNAVLGRWESFWAPASYSAVALQTPDDVVDKVAYTLANPVAAGLVERGRDWPGLWSGPRQAGQGICVKRPGVFFRAKGPLPDEARLELAVPEGFASAEEFGERVAAALADREERARAALREQRREPLGAAAVVEEEPSSQPKPNEPRRQLRPRVAARDKWKRIEALGRLVEFLRTYREAWRALRSGLRDVVFPAGTYSLRVFHGVRCAAPG
jgi:REP element-mobilizing transposase RayT